MDWALAIDRNRTALLRLLAMVFAAAGIVAGGSVAKLPRRVRLQILSMLRPAESALRRLIVIAARGLVVAQRTDRTGPVVPISPGAKTRLPGFSLFDPTKRFDVAPRRFAAAGPRISFFDEPRPPEPEARNPSPDDLMSAERLCGRLNALQRVLDDLPRHARRFARWRERRRQMPPGSGRTWPFRPGWPPGHRARPRREIDTILADCHSLAFRVLDNPDTS